jgi:hypothetical protein
MAFTAEELKKANEQIKTVPIKGKEYAQVPERIRAFRTLIPNGVITTEILKLEDGVVTMKATISDENGVVLATGHAQEKESSSFINKTSFIENCETSAVGRALGMCGIGVDVSIASAEEVQNAMNNQNAYPSRDEIVKLAKAKYPEGTEEESRLLKFYKVESLDRLSDSQLQALYNKKLTK